MWKAWGDDSDDDDDDDDELRRSSVDKMRDSEDVEMGNGLVLV